MKVLPLSFMALLFSFTLHAETSSAATVTFGDLTAGSKTYSADVDGDGMDDVIFSTTHQSGFEAGYASSPTLIEGSGLKAASTSQDDLEVRFNHGLKEYLQFDFAVTTYDDKVGGYVYFWVYDAEGWPIGNSHKVMAQPTGDFARHEATVSVDVDRTAASATFNFVTMGGGNWYVIDNFEGTFGSGESPLTDASMAVFPEIIDFGGIPMATSSTPLEVAISNLGDAEVQVSSIGIQGSDASQFAIQNDKCSDRLYKPAETFTLDVVFDPRSLGHKQAALSVSSEAPVTPLYSIPVTGVGCPRIDSINPNPALANQTVVVFGEGFERLQWVKIGARKFDKDCGKIPSWDGGWIILKLPNYKQWRKGSTREKTAIVGVKEGDEILKSNEYLLSVQKP